MFKRLRGFFRRASTRAPTEPAPSTFGSEANKIQEDRDRDAEWEKQVAIQKGRVKGF